MSSPAENETPIRTIEILTITKETKTSKRVTHYILETMPEEDVPSPTCRLTVKSDWTRTDGQPANPEPHEVYEVSAHQLMHFITSNPNNKVKK